MSKRAKLIVAGLGIAALIAIPVVGTAFAAGPTTPNSSGAAGQYYCGYAGGSYLNSVSTLLGLTPAEIQTQLQNGQSLVEIAATKGVTESALVDAILTPMKQQVQQMVTAGYLTQQQAEQRVQLMTQNIQAAVNAKGAVYNGANGLNGYGMMGGWGSMMRGWNGNQGNTNGAGTNGGWGGMMGGWR